MAIVQCPVCQKRISSLSKACPHCHAPLGDMTPEKREQIAALKRQRHMHWARRISLFALTLALVGALGWWFSQDTGWQWPPPAWALGVLLMSLIFYVVGRAWLLWLHLAKSTKRRI
jgi:hypothetical protein